MRHIFRFSLALIAVGPLCAMTAQAQSPGVREWRAAHERAIIDELRGLVSLPNVAGNDADMQ
ncbi:MAG: hypothetical protein ABI880_09890, partial [Acidobacteriota bacterium]